MSQSQPYDRPPMPLLGNSSMLAATGAKANLLLAPGQNTRVAEWSSEESEQQELELLAWVVPPVEGGLIPGLPPPLAAAIDASIWVRFYLNLVAQVGAAGASGISVETRLSVPANGLRYRFRGKQASLAAVGGAGTALQFTLASVIYPVAGDTASESSYEVVQYDSAATPIPKGARAFRCSPGVLGGADPVSFYDLAGAFVSSFSPSVVTDWLDIPRGAYSVSAATSWPAAGERYTYGSTVFFRS